MYTPSIIPRSKKPAGRSSNEIVDRGVPPHPERISLKSKRAVAMGLPWVTAGEIGGLCGVVFGG